MANFVSYCKVLVILFEISKAQFHIQKICRDFCNVTS